METPNSDNYTLGKGTISFNRDIDGVYQGYRDLGNAPSLTLSIDISKLDHFSSRSGVKSKDKSIILEVTPTLGFTIDEITDKNFAMSLLGVTSESTQTGDVAAETAVTVGSVLDIYTDLDHKKVKGVTYIEFDTMTSAMDVTGTLTGANSGATATIEDAYADSATAGVIVLSNVVGVFEDGEIIDDGGTGSASASGTVVEMAENDVLVMDLSATLIIYTAGTDYMVNTISGQILYKSSGGIVATDSLTVAYEAEAGTFSTINMLQSTEVKGAFHFVSDNATGSNYELELWDVTMTPDGELSLIGEEWLSLAFTGEILKDESGHPTQPYGRMIIDIT